MVGWEHAIEHVDADVIVFPVDGVVARVGAGVVPVPAEITAFVSGAEAAVTPTRETPTTPVRSTLDDVRSPERGPRRARFRHVGIGLLLLVVLAGATGLLGVRSATVTGEGGGFTLTLTYPKVARSGLDAPWRARLQRPEGFDGPITLSVTASYFHIFETQGLTPEAAGETTDGDRRYLTFDPPEGTEFVLDYDAYIQPSSQLGRSGELAVVVDGRPVVTVEFTTWLVP